ncbi:MAG: beta-galactosidase [Bacillota bacterium]|nr:beta-galactosidase [Bacillota bacterium]
MQFRIAKTGHEPALLHMSGKAKNGDLYEVTSRYLMKNKKPILPIMGELHFSRWHPDEWREAILKMRAGGITIVSTYVFWIHHEEKEGEWDFAGSRDLRRFLEVCRRLEMPVWLRIGPWNLGECRNGGFPDWLVQGGFRLRENDPQYLHHVRRYWTKLAEQAEGMMVKDGGPVIGIQIENEYGHCYQRPKTEAEGLEHLQTLKQMAQGLGFITPYYTVTAWGGAYVLAGETLPVYGGYVDAPWAQHTEELPASEQFLFIPFHDDVKIGADLAEAIDRTGSVQAQPNAEPQQQAQPQASAQAGPYLTAELGGGLQVTAHRRPYPYPEDTEAQALCALGSGANLIGYYMYHGGYNPEGRYSTLQESKATGYHNDLPVKSYDFQACIRESGLLNASYGKLKKLHLFLKDFQETLAQAEVYLPDIRPKSPEDLETVRAAVRHNYETGEGFLFINNHQRKRTMKAHKNWSCVLAFDHETITLENIDIDPGECLVIPYNLRIGSALLLRTNASFLCRLGEYCVFYTDHTPWYHYAREAGCVITLNKWEAERAYKFGSRLIIADCVLYEDDGEIYAVSSKPEEEIIYYGPDGLRRSKTVRFKQVECDASFTYLGEANGENGRCRKYQVRINARNRDQVHDLFLQIDYHGDRAEVYHEGKLVADWFTTGEQWHLALKRFNYCSELELWVYPSRENVYYDLPVKNGWSLEKINIFSCQKTKVFA